MKPNKLWSIFMVLTLVLGTAIAFSSCKKDSDDKEDGNVSGNYILVNGRKAGISVCELSSRNTLYLEIEDGIWEGDINVIPANGNIQNGVQKAVIEGGMEKVDGEDECGFYFNNVPCTININNNTISFSATSVIGMFKPYGGSEMPTTATINYNGVLTRSK